MFFSHKGFNFSFLSDKNCLKVVQTCLESISGDLYFSLSPLRYFWREEAMPRGSLIRKIILTSFCRVVLRLLMDLRRMTLWERSFLGTSC